MTRAGIVTVVGRPNAGKSTLLNRLVGQKLSITSPKPQTTRDRVVGILTSDEAQLVLFDTPGLLNPRYALQSAMRAAALEALRDADVVLYLVDATEATVPPLEVAAELSSPPRAPIVLGLNKVDLLAAAERERRRAEHPTAHLVSATTGEGVDALLAELTRHLPESPFLYDAEDVSTQTLRFFASELVRETALEQLDDEVPYSVACEIEEFREDRTPLYIRAVIHVERDSQKRILIGAGGARIREIGRASRHKLEALVGAQVYLDLWVKVLPNWRRKPAVMRRFGYRVSEEERT
jgi:GTP-binding protein Era